MKYVKINDEGQIIEIANNKVLKLSTHIIVNPKEEDFINAGFYPILNPDEMPLSDDAFYSKAAYKFNDDHTGILKYYVYTEKPTPTENDGEDNIDDESDLEPNDNIIDTINEEG